MSKVWLITGSSRGLGRELAKAVLGGGDRLVATARKPEELKDLVALAPDRAIAVALDVTKPEAARPAIAAAKEKFGRIDVLVNNAGYANPSSVEDADEADFRTQFETNYWGVFHVVRAALPLLRTQEGGAHIINVSSIGGRLGSAGLGSYQSAKWAMEGLSEVLQAEVGPLGIKVTIVEPGGFATDWAGSSMVIHESSPAYADTVNARWKQMQSHAGATQGDPAKAGQAFLKLAAMKDPPLRLLLGTDALLLAELVGKRRDKEDAKYKDLTSSTDRAGTQAFATRRSARRSSNGSSDAALSRALVAAARLRRESRDRSPSGLAPRRAAAARAGRAADAARHRAVLRVLGGHRGALGGSRSRLRDRQRGGEDR